MESKTDEGDTALHLASMFQHLLIVQFLVKHGANLEAQNIADDRPLHLASLSGKLATVQFLVESG